MEFELESGTVRWNPPGGAEEDELVKFGVLLSVALSLKRIADALELAAELK